MFVISLFVVAVVWATLMTPEANGPGVGVIPRIYDAENVPMAAVFAGWYGYDSASGECIGGLGSTHWNGGPNTAGVRYTPGKVYYCSSGPEVISWQLDQWRRLA